MSVTPDALLAAAVILGRGNGEVDWRNATSRAYYAAFHCCRAVAEQARLSVPETGSGHKGLVDALTRGLNPSSLKSLGYMLEQCRQRRIEADYDIQQLFPRQLAETVLDDCRRILAKAKSVA